MSSAAVERELLNAAVPGMSWTWVEAAQKARPGNVPDAIRLLRIWSLKITHPWITNHGVKYAIAMHKGDLGLAYDTLSGLEHAGDRSLIKIQPRVNRGSPIGRDGPYF